MFAAFCLVHIPDGGLNEVWCFSVAASEILGS